MPAATLPRTAPRARARLVGRAVAAGVGHERHDAGAVGVVGAAALGRVEGREASPSRSSWSFRRRRRAPLAKPTPAPQRPPRSQDAGRTSARGMRRSPAAGGGWRWWPGEWRLRWRRWTSGASPVATARHSLRGMGRGALTELGSDERVLWRKALGRPCGLTAAALQQATAGHVWVLAVAGPAKGHHCARSELACVQAEGGRAAALEGGAAGA